MADIDVGAISEALNNKADIDAGNFSEQGGGAIVGMMALDYSNPTTISALPYTATERGVVFVEASGIEGYQYLYVNGVKVDRGGGSYNYGHMLHALVDIGDTVTQTGNATETSIRFIPFKGVK